MPGPVKRVIVRETHCHVLTRRVTPFHTQCVCHALSRVITQLLLVTPSRHRHFLLSCGPTVTALDGKHVDCHTFNLIYSSLGGKHAHLVAMLIDFVCLNSLLK